jgi:FixJ family two-component response regulator
MLRRAAHLTFGFKQVCTKWLMAYGRGIIAVVDDDESLGRALTRLLAAHDMEARSYISGSAFLKEFHNFNFTCVLLDLHMETLSGIQVMERLAAMEATAPVIIMTGNVVQNASKAAFDSGAKAFLEKPIDEAVLVSTISQVTLGGMQ